MPHTSPIPPAAAIDAYLWDAGCKNARNSGNPVELDFLRGFHHLDSLAHLRREEGYKVAVVRSARALRFGPMDINLCGIGINRDARRRHLALGTGFVFA